MGKKIALRPCKRCGIPSPKPLKRDGSGRAEDWPTHAQGFLCDACIAVHRSRLIPLKPCKRCGVLSPKPLKADGVTRVKNWPPPSHGFVCDACFAEHFRGGMRAERHPRWRGGRSTIHKNGYVRVWTGIGKERDLEHRVVWRQAHGPIPPGHHIHHLDGDKQNNRLENLALVENHAHQEIHRAERSLNGRWSVAHERCVQCGTTDRPHQARGLCNLCHGRQVYKSKAGLPSKPSKDRRPADGRWSVAHPACVSCGTTEHRHEARGLCVRCYYHATKR